jgi:hypothetical protein
MVTVATYEWEYVYAAPSDVLRDLIDTINRGMKRLGRFLFPNPMIRWA